MEAENRSNYWPQLILIAAAAANLFRFVEPLKSSRPTEAPPQERRAISEPNIEARLWQDPFEAVALREARVPGSKPPETNGASPLPRYSLSNLATQMQRLSRSDAYSNNVTVLAVMVPGNPYTEGIEQRLRARYAVLAALIECGAYPEQSEFIGQLQVPWFRSGSLHPELRPQPDSVPVLPDTLNGQTDWLSIPYEWLMGRIPVERGGVKSNTAILVLWLREEAFEDYPKLRLAQLIGRIREDFFKTGYKHSRDPTRDLLSFRIIGPAQSSTLIQMLDSAVDKGSWCFESKSTSSNLPAVAVAGKTVQQILARRGEGIETRFYCATATAADEVLMIPPQWATSPRPRDYVRKQFWSNDMYFTSTCTTDRELIEEILNELERRGVNTGSAKPSVAVLTEFDTFYGRVMAETFTNLVARRQIEEQAGKNWWAKQKDSLFGITAPKTPIVLHYLRGVDGQVAGATERKAEKPEKNSQSDDKEKAQASRKHMEMPEGRSQLDYIPRLVRRLRTLERTNDLKAIGILGSDVYDKLLLLQSLRNQFPDVIFFTTELDARLFHPRELAWSRNLLVASSYGLQLSDDLQGKIPPFRDSSQSALFVACLRAMGHQPMASHSVLEPRIFEIGRREPVDLSVQSSRFHPTRSGLMGEPDRHATASFLWSILLVPLLVLGLAPLSVRLRQGLGALAVLYGCMFSTKLRQKLAPPFKPEHAWAYFIGAWGLLILAFLLMAIIYRNHYSPTGEVFSVWDGVSVWPSEILRLIGFYLSVAGLIYGWSILDKSNAQLSKTYGLPRAVRQRPFSWRQVWSSFLPSSRPRRRASISRWSPKGERPLDIRRLWIRYLRLGSLQNRVNRFVPPSVFYFMFGILLVVALGFPMVPYRGDALVKAVDIACLFLFIPAFVLLMFAVLDDTRLNTRFLTLLSRPTDWSAAKDNIAVKRGMKPMYLDDYRDMRFIAERTAAVSSLIYLPFGLLALMVVSRNEVFDRWGWPSSLLVLFGLNSLFTLYSAISMKRAALRARSTAVGNLRNHLVRVLGSAGADKEQVAEQLRETIEEIKALRKGAFAPLPVHPALGAALLPFGGAGIVALLQYLAGQ